ncbi:MAG: cytochrome c oxidase assembly factor Coa1 family protein [Candidatus Polarisedimenticolia bacterium]
MKTDLETRSRNTPDRSTGASGGSGRPGAFVMGLVRLLLSFVFRVFRSSGAWKEAVRRATSHPEVVRALGQPVRPGPWVGGHIRVSGPDGDAAFTAPLHGSLADAALRAVARRVEGVWRFDVLQVQVRGGGCIDLLAESAPRVTGRPAPALPPASRRLPPG